jgi:hypothetical protein
MVGQWIKIKFARGPARRMLMGRKTCTSRIQQKGHIGDRFHYHGHTYEITLTGRRTVEYIVRHFYNAEGYDTPQEYLDDITNAYPDIQYTDKLYIHFFREIHYTYKPFMEMI